MTFRLYIYYCALCGAWTALLGWYLGRMDWVHKLTGGANDSTLGSGLKGMCLGLLVSLGLSLVDSVWTLSFRQVGQIFLRVLVAVGVGLLGGLLGGLAGQFLFQKKPLDFFLIFGWTVTGFLIGISIGAFEVLSQMVRGENRTGAMRKVVNGVLGGTAGGLLGGFLSVVLRGTWKSLLADKPSEDLWSPSAIGFVILGLCIGLFIGLAQVILKEAWVKIEKGRRAGREMILTKQETTIGRAEACDIGLFGDNTIERDHARIIIEGNRYYLVDSGTPAGTFLNEDRITGPALLRSGDAIGVGASILRFGERAKQTS